MESLEKLQNQLGSLGELRSIVKTMKTLSAASIHQYESVVAALANYTQTIERGLYVVLKDNKQQESLHNERASDGRSAAIVFGSDHGLCGRFNQQIVDYSLRELRRRTTQHDNTMLLAVGARVESTLEYHENKPDSTFYLPATAGQITNKVQQIILKLDEWRAQYAITNVYLFYNQHSSTESSHQSTDDDQDGASQRTKQIYHSTGFRLSPVDLNRFNQQELGAWPSNRLPTYSMDQEQLLSRLLHQYLFVSIFKACGESQASEHLSRLSLMQSAERNLQDRVEQITGLYRRARQTVITNELQDIIAGYEAITGRSS